MRFFSWLVTLLIVGVVFIFARANMAVVSIAFWPFDAAVEGPVYLWVMIPLTVGLVIGAVLTWFGTLGPRFEVRRLRKELALEKEKQKPIVPSRNWFRR